MTKHCRKPSHSRPKRKSLKIIQIQEAIAGEIKESQTLNMRQKSHLLSQNVFLQSVIYPSEKKKIHWNKQHFGMSKSRVLPTLPSSSSETAVKKISIWVFFACNQYPSQLTDDKCNDSSLREGIPLDAVN